MKFGLRRVVPLGRLHWSALRLNYGMWTAGLPPPTSVDYLTALPDWLGMMGNNTVGDCFDAAMYHGDQVLTQFAQGACVTQDDQYVVDLYSEITGYAGTPETDKGSDPYQSFTWVENNGLPRADGTAVKLIAAIEIDPRQPSDVMEAMAACGGLMVGFNVPSSLEQNMGALVWDYDPSNAQIVGGHEIFVAKHLSPSANFGLISWGQKNFEMTPNFWAAYVNQVTACVWSDWLESTGLTPFGMTETQLVAEMQ